MSQFDADSDLGKAIQAKYDRVMEDMDGSCKRMLENWDETIARYKADEYVYKVRDKEIRVPTHTESLSHTQIPRVVLPKHRDWGDILQWNLQEGVPGAFPYAAGVFPFKRKGEDPTRMFAGEGGPERTNKRFHYVSEGLPAKRLSTAFDSVTLYGEDPDHRPDIYGKIGNSGVSICCLDDAKKLYSGFDLCNPKTSVSDATRTYRRRSTRRGCIQSIKSKSTFFSTWYSSSRYSQRRSSAKYLYIFYRVFTQTNG